MPKKETSGEREAKKAIADAKALLREVKRKAHAWQKAKATAYLIEQNWSLSEIWLHLASEKNLQATFDEAEQADDDRIREKAYRMALQIIVMLTSDQQTAWLKITDAANMSGIEKSIISAAVTAGRLKSNGKTRRERRIDAVDFSRWLNERAGKLKAPNGAPPADGKYYWNRNRDDD